MLAEHLKKVWRWFFPNQTKTNTSKNQSTESIPSTTLESFGVFSDVKLMDQSKGIELEGWVIEKLPSSFSIVYTDERKQLQEIHKIPIERPLNRSEFKYKDYIIKFI